MTQRIYTSQEHTRTRLVTYKEEYIKSYPVPHLPRNLNVC